jgi:hypothetical protein
MDLTKEELEALTLLAQSGQQSVASGIAEKLVTLGLVERQLGRWIVTSRGHAVVLRQGKS